MRLPRPLQILLLAYFVLGLVYDQATPTFEASDEVWHYGLVRELAAGRGLPVQRVGVMTPYRQEGSQAPIYYALGAALTFRIDASDFAERYIYNTFAQAGIPGTPVNANMMRHSSAEAFPWTSTTLATRLIRWFSLLLGAGTTLLTYRLTLALFPERTLLALSAGAFTAFNPMFLFISASVNNDNGLWLISSFTIYLIVVAVIQETAGWPSEAGFPLARLLTPQMLPWSLGICLGGAIMTKLSGLVLVPVIGLFLVWRAWRRKNWRGSIVDSCIVTACVLVLTGWWFYRNLILYDELLGVRMMRAIVGAERPRPASILDLMMEVQGWWFSLWGVFGAFSLLPGRWVYAVFTGCVLLAGGGGVRAIWQTRGKSGRPVAAYTAHGFSLIFIALSFVGIVYWTMTQYASQGRLVLGAIGPMSSFLAAGIIQLFGRRWEMSICRFITVGLFAVALVVPIVYIAPRYAPPIPLVETDLPSDLIPIQATFNREFALLGYTVDRQPPRPGEAVAVTLYWRGFTQMDKDYNLALNVHGRDYENIGKLDTWPGGGLLPTGNWQPGAIYTDSYELPLMESAAAPTVLRLDVSFWVYDLANRLPITADDGRPVTSLILDIGRLIPPEPLAFTPLFNAGSTFEEGISLLGYDIPTQAARGETVPITLYWQASQPIIGDYTVFVHLLDRSGTIVAQADSPPLNGDWPTSAWEPGYPLADLHVVHLPADLSDSEYRFAIGLYEPVTGTRLAAFAPDGGEWRDSAIRTEAAIAIP